MKAKIVSMRRLGLNCWSPKRFFGLCWRCPRYSECSLKERVSNKEYDELVRKLSREKRRLEEYIKKKCS